jgi:hypothetical protein
MRRRRVIAGLVVLALVGVAAVMLWPRGPRPSRATFEQVREGMTFEEVCATVGGPPGDYSDGGVSTIHTHWHPPDMWWAEDGVLGVRFGDDGRAWQVIVTDGLPLSRWFRLRARLGL